jgi:hypothetical protein
MTRTTVGRAKSLLCVAGLAFGGILLFAGTDWSNKDASTWTDADVRAILNDSPWSKQSKLSYTQSGNSSGNNGGYGGGGGGMGGGGIGGGGIGGGGMGGGMGGGGMGGGGRGMGGNRGGMGRNSQPDVDVTIQWYSSKPVRLANQKRQNSDAKVEALQPLDHYVIAVVGFPSGSGSRRSADSDDSDSDSQQTEMSESMQNRFKDGSMLSRKGHDPIHPDKAAWDNSTGTRTLMLYFPKTDAIAAADKDVEVQIATGRMQLKKKFALKEMTYGGNLEL